MVIGTGCQYKKYIALTPPVGGTHAGFNRQAEVVPGMHTKGASQILEFINNHILAWHSYVGLTGHCCMVPS